jgi:hypothetical protein
VTKREENSAEARRTNFFVILLYTTNREIFASPFSTSALPQFILLMNLFSTYLFPFRHSSTTNHICSHYRPKQAFQCSSGYKSAGNKQFLQHGGIITTNKEKKYMNRYGVHLITVHPFLCNISTNRNTQEEHNIPFLSAKVHYKRDFS